MNHSGHDTGILPLADIRRMLSKCRGHEQAKGNNGQFLAPEWITVSDVAFECNVPCRSKLHRLIRGDADCDLRDVPLRRLSRFLLRVEHGLVVKRSGKVVHLTEDQRDAEAAAMHRPPKRPDHRGHLEWIRGVPRLVLDPPPPIPRSMPKFVEDVKFSKG
jgi:hypothetical protein